MPRYSSNIGKSIYVGVFGGVLLFAIQLRPLESASNALKDAVVPLNGELPTLVLDSTNWVIIRKSMTWGEAVTTCDEKYFRLAVLPTIDDAKALVAQIVSKSEKYTPDYDKKNKEIEFGMDRRYWIGLTDIVQEGKWYWINDGSELAYEFWYPNQPDHQKINGALKSGEHCVTLWNPAYHAKDNHSFNDDECKNKYYAICDVAEV